MSKSNGKKSCWDFFCRCFGGSGSARVYKFADGSDPDVKDATTATSSSGSQETVEAKKRGIKQSIVVERELLTKPRGQKKLPTDLTPRDKKDQYVDAIYDTQQSLYYLENTPYDDIEETLNAFNESFDQAFLVMSVSVPVRKNNFFEPLDSDKIRVLRRGLADTHHEKNNTRGNLLKAFLYVYDQMNRNYNQHKLSYHSFRHALEVAFDIYTLMSRHAESKPVHLLMLLAALFHDVQFTFNRIDDEVASGEALKSFLRPVLDLLAPDQQSVIAALIQVIIPGASTPAFINKRQSHKTEVFKTPMVDNVFEIANALRRELPARYKKSSDFCALLAQWMTDVDLNRTSILLIFEAQVLQMRQEFEAVQTFQEAEMPEQNSSWMLLDEFYPRSIRNLPLDHLRFKARLTQGLRVLGETLAESIKDEQLHADFKDMTPACKLVFLINHYQHSQQAVGVEINEADIAFLVEKITGEMQFASRMHNSCDEISPELRLSAHYDLVNDWHEHVRVLAAIHDCLIDTKVTLSSKQDVFMALVHVASQQSGGDNIVEKVIEMLNSMSELVMKQVINSPQSFSPIHI